MSLRINGKNCLFLTSLLLIASFAYAAGEKKIPCPAVSMIQHAAQNIDRAIKVETPDGDYYTALSSKPAIFESGLPWRVFANVDAKTANSVEAAIFAAKEMLTRSSSSKNKYATKFFGDRVFCEYGPYEVAAIGGDLPIPSGFKFKH